GSALNIDPKRYIQVTPQVRRMPVGIVLTMDQAYIEDLLSQFVNSRLRFQPTQVQWQQEMRTLKPYDSEKHGQGDAAGGAAARGGMRGGGDRPMGGPMMMGGGAGMMGAGSGPGMMISMQGQAARMGGMMGGMGGALM